MASPATIAFTTVVVATVLERRLTGRVHRLGTTIVSVGGAAVVWTLVALGLLAWAIIEMVTIPESRLLASFLLLPASAGAAYLAWLNARSAFRLRAREDRSSDPHDRGVDEGGPDE